MGQKDDRPQLHLTVAREILDVKTWFLSPAGPSRPSESTHPAEDGHQVMLAHGEHVDVLDDHHLVVVLVEDGVVHHVCGDRSGTVETVDGNLLPSTHVSISGSSWTCRVSLKTFLLLSRRLLQLSMLTQQPKGEEPRLKLGDHPDR